MTYRYCVCALPAGQAIGVLLARTWYLTIKSNRIKPSNICTRARVYSYTCIVCNNEFLISPNVYKGNGWTKSLPWSVQSYIRYLWSHQCGIDFVGPISPTSSAANRYSQTISHCSPLPSLQAYAGGRTFILSTTRNVQWKRTLLSNPDSLEL